ncbi:hypothetical protein [Acinetobacter baumannii]|uniref:hypothetical protein n=1 Tax=Acinetobacter baumannii TaxID=470 RepID=UPI0021C8CE83|nr:hypothetical protein [Acinetobacter baumannii]
MDKKALQEQFEEFARWYVLPLDKSADGVYQALETQSAWMSFQHQQAKVEELKATIKGNHGRIAELERLNRVKAQAILDLHQEIKELKASHHGEVIGHEVHLKKIKQERDELQKRVDACQKLLNELKDAKAELVECDLYDKGVRCALYSVIQDLEQALKGGEA